MSDSYHSGDFVHALQELHDLGLVSGLHTGEQAGLGAGGTLLRNGEVVKLATRVGLASCVFVFIENANTPEIYKFINL